jgi:probable RNA-binding protein EIF1AD
MSGLGRRSHYRKHLTSNILNNLPEPEVDDVIARVVGSRGGNIIEIEVPVVTTTTATSATTGDSEGSNDAGAPAGVASSLSLMPTKYHKLIWVKRGDFLIVTGSSSDYTTQVAADDKDAGGGKIGYMVKHILFSEQVKHLRNKGIWPEVFQNDSVVDSDDEDDNITQTSNSNSNSNNTTTVADDGIVYASNDYDDYDSEEDEGGGLGENMNLNKGKSIKGHVESSDSESDDE